MRYQRTVAFVLCLTALLFTTPLLFAQTESQTNKPSAPPASAEEERILKLLQKISTWPQTIEPTDYLQAIYEELLGCAGIAAKLNSERIVQAIVDFPVHDPDVGEAKMMALRRFNGNPAAHACVVEALTHPEQKIQKNAAQVLFHWGEWDLAIPIIHKYGFYEAMEVDYWGREPDPPRLIPILQEGARTSTWEGRTLAAFYLQSFGDSTTIVAVARDVVAHAPSDVDNSSVARAKYTALRTLARYHVTDNISDIARLADNQSALVRIQVVDILQLYAYNGIEEARRVLEQITESNADLKTRETAKAALSKIDQK
jgi:hypothetical protein